VLFLASGEILLAEGTSEIAKVPALLSRRPVLGGIFGFGLIALLGLPPFSLFASELNMVRAEFAAGLGWAAAIALICMAVIFAAVMAHGRHLLLGDAAPQGRREATPRAVAVPLAAGLIACAVIGVSAWPLQPLLHAAARVVS
jgi:hydrogenase-4 component F